MLGKDEGVIVAKDASRQTAAEAASDDVAVAEPCAQAARTRITHASAKRAEERTRSVQGDPQRAHRSPAWSERMTRETVEPAVGFEPTTFRLQGGCSTRLSYTGVASRV